MLEMHFYFIPGAQMHRDIPTPVWLPYSSHNFNRTHSIVKESTRSKNMADSNPKLAATKHIFQLWQSQARRKMEKKKCHALANRIHQVSTYNEYWQRWSQHLEKKRRLKSMRKQAKAIHQLTTLKQSLQTWKEKCQQVRDCRWKSAQVKRLHQRKLLQFTFLVWRNYSKNFHFEASKTTRLKRIRRNLVYRKTMAGWKSVLAGTREQQALESKALDLRRVEIFNAWFREFNLNKYKKRRINEFMQMSHFNLCSASFERWKNYLNIQFQENVKIRKLSALYRRMKLRRFFLVWRMWARDKQSKRQTLDEKQREVNAIFVRHLFEVNV